MKHDSSKKIEYTIGLVLLSIYIFTTYVAVDIIVSKQINTLTLYAFLAWGMLTTLLYGIKTKIPTYSAWYLVFMVASLFAMSYSPEFKIMSGQFYLMIVSFLVTYFVQLFINSEKDFEKLCWVYALSSFAMVLMLQFTGNLVGSVEERLGGELLDNANNFAIVIMVATMLELWLLIYNSKTFVKKILLTAIILYNMYALALAASRKNFIVPFLFLYILLICKINKKGKRNIVFYTVISILLVVIAFTAIMNIPALYESVGTRFESSFIEEDKESDAYWSKTIREEMRNDSIEQWKGKPIFGYGFDSYKYRAKEVVGRFFNSHCNYTELLYNGGIIYFCIYYWIFFELIRGFFKKKNVDQKYRAFAIAVTLAWLFLDYGEVTYSIATIQIILAIALRTLNFSCDNNDVGKDMKVNE